MNNLAVSEGEQNSEHGIKFAVFYDIYKTMSGHMIFCRIGHTMDGQPRF